MKLILETNNVSILESIKEVFVRNSNVDFWDHLSPTQKEEIQQGIKEVEHGETIDMDDFLKVHRQ